ncbi:BMP family lipoprotein [Arenivirga flava]|uniref:BMP family ABC transporter substrate-binding protein n=1 Tax=Arenivirga flava TaxID=1930060 RepID=A0AA37X924_9MICO|nr:BMP family ABC transporter substrate-binding protein [Arenivirga flava]GMA28094.1 BMP family ABC transporter substrate-binding protein [Arenivirga flava]
MNTTTRKRALALAAFGAASALVLAGCAEAPEETTGNGGDDNSDFTACMVSDFGGFEDGSFNESAYAGLLQAEDELGITIRETESTSEDEYVPNVNALVGEDCGIIIGVGFALANAVRDSARENEDVNYAIIDSALSEDDFSPLALDNVKPVLYDTAQAAFLAGYLAAGVSETGVVGTFGGNPFPSVTIFMEGYAQGVEAYNEANGTDVQVLGTDSFVGNFEDISAGQTLSEQLIAQGADVIMPVAGPVGQGTGIAALASDGVRVVGVDTDWYTNPAHDEYKSLLLTSVEKSLQLTVFETIEAALNGEFDATTYVGTLENEGVTISDFHDQASSVSDELAAEVEALREQIESGELVITTEGTPTA